MIAVYTGTPGSGKSYHAASLMWDKLRLNHPVITNISLNLPEKYFGKVKNWRYYQKEIWDITPAFLEEFSENFKKEKGWKRVPEDYIFLVIDEAQLIFNCRNWNDKDRKAWIAFFQLHRKLGYCVILITQMQKMLDAQIRGLVEYEHVHRKISNFGWKGFLLSLFLLSPKAFIDVTMWAVLREKVGVELFRFHKSIAMLYDTNRMFSIEKKEEENDS